MAVKATAFVTLSCVVDVSACYRYYLLQSSTKTKPAKPTAKPPGGSWTDVEPTYTAGSTNSLYLVDLTVFSDGTFAYSAVSLSSSYEAAKAAWNKAQAALEAANEALSNTEVIVGTQTASTGAWTGVASFSALKDGQQIAYWLPYAGSGNATLNLTLSDGTTTGAIACYYSGTTRLTTHYAAGNVIHLTYRVNASVSGTLYTGWWADANYDSNTYDRIRFNNSITAKTAITSGYLIVGDGSGFYHLGASVKFDVNKPILYASAAIAAAATGTSNFIAFPGISLRTTLGNSSWTATKGATIYLAGTLDGTGFTTRASGWLTTNPNEESVIYIALGYMYSTYQMYLYPEHPIYRVNNGQLMTISQLSYQAYLSATEAGTIASDTQSKLNRFMRFDVATGLHIGDNQTANEVLIDSESMNIVMNGQKYSRFAANYVQFGQYQLRKSADGGLVFKLKG